MTAFRCQACGWEAPLEFVYCQDCGAPGAMKAERPPVNDMRSSAPPELEVPPRLSEISGAIAYDPTGVAAFDRALGGGLVLGQTILLAGAPGAGKTTLILVAAERYAGERGLYVTSEETAERIKGRVEGLGVTEIRVARATDPVKIEELADRWARGILIVDSLNELEDPSLPTLPGSPSQVKLCAGILLRWARRTQVPLVLIGHVTWEERFQGPRTIEHLVDTVLYYERDPETDDQRALQVRKNRFGPVHVVRIPRTALEG